MFLIDTHVLLWLISDDRPVPKVTLTKLHHAKKKQALYVSSISFWEIALLVKKGRLILNAELHKWVTKVLDLPYINVINPDPLIFMESVGLENFHADPADRIIVATSRQMNLPVVTKDEKIRQYAGVQTIWE